MRKIAVGLMIASMLAVVPTAGAATPKLKMTISNFRYCQAATCTPLDVGYVRSDTGPVGIDNPQAVVEVKRGAIVSWVYMDDACDMFGCPGHNVIFENGTVQGVRKGFVKAGQQGKAINVRIKEKVGTTIRYFCSVNAHYQEGMTGILKVV
jgi:plastocyanin